MSDQPIGPIILDPPPNEPSAFWHVANVNGKLCVYQDGVEVFQAALDLLRKVDDCETAAEEVGDRSPIAGEPITAIRDLLGRIDGITVRPVR